MGALRACENSQPQNARQHPDHRGEGAPPPQRSAAVRSREVYRSSRRYNYSINIILRHKNEQYRLHFHQNKNIIPSVINARGQDYLSAAAVT
jgi:hypothetical protein